MATIIDLSKTIKNYPDDPAYMQVTIDHHDHAQSHKLLELFLKLPKKLFPKKFIGWADDTITHMGVHSTTHIDAPWHYSPTVDGKKAKTIDEMPLDWGYGDGVVLNMTHKQDNETISKADIIKEIERLSITIKPGNIVLIRTDRDKYIGTANYPEHGTGMSREATEYLIDLGVKVMGIDQWGWDIPLQKQAAMAIESDNSELFWEGHMVGAEKEYFHMEQLVNLKSLPETGFKVAVFPLKIEGASAAPARVVGIVE